MMSMSSFTLTLGFVGIFCSFLVMKILYIIFVVEILFVDSYH